MLLNSFATLKQGDKKASYSFSLELSCSLSPFFAFSLFLILIKVFNIRLINSCKGLCMVFGSFEIIFLTMGLNLLSPKPFATNMQGKSSLFNTFAIMLLDLLMSELSQYKLSATSSLFFSSRSIFKATKYTPVCA